MNIASTIHSTVIAYGAQLAQQQHAAQASAVDTSPVETASAASASRRDMLPMLRPSSTTDMVVYYYGQLA